jgi:hypothetical protein
MSMAFKHDKGKEPLFPQNDFYEIKNNIGFLH